MNYYRNIDKTRIQFDFFFDEDSINIPYEEIEKLGGKVIIVPPYQKVIKYHIELKKFLRNGKYKIVHSHLNTLSVFSLYAAKKAGVPIRIAHSHSTTNKKEWKKNFIKLFLRPFIRFVATDYMACTEHAGRWMFGDKEYNNGKVYILNNAIEIDNFLFDNEVREEKRKELNIDKNTIVIGHIGRFVEQKNHSFLIDIFNEFHKHNSNTILLLIGQGPLIDKMQEKVNKLGIDRYVKFVGQRNDVNELYLVMDLFLFPSLYEGLGMVMVEAQCSGLPCIASTEVPIIAKVNENVEFVSLEKSIQTWIDIIKRYNTYSRSANIDNMTKAGYNIKTEAIKLEGKYFELLDRIDEKVK